LLAAYVFPTIQTLLAEIAVTAFKAASCARLTPGTTLQLRPFQCSIKVVSYGLNIQCYPNEHVVELAERKIAQQWKKRLEDDEE
jgi:hypothetical protein